MCRLPRDPSGKGLGKVLERQPAHGLPCGRRGRLQETRCAGLRASLENRKQKKHSLGLIFPVVGRPVSCRTVGATPAAPPTRQWQPHPNSECDNQNCVPTLPGVSRGQIQP